MTIRKKKVFLEDAISPTIPDALMSDVSKTLLKQINQENFNKKYARVGDVLKLVGAGVFIAGSLVMPNLPLVLKPFLDHQRKSEMRVWKRFNIPYLERTLNRLEKQKLVEFDNDNGVQIVKITEAGKRRVLRFAIDELAVEKPKIWDGRWYLISYDIPGKLRRLRNIFREYLQAWGFYSLHESALLHAYPCQNQVDFLREYLGIGRYVRIFTITKIENDKLFRDFFGV